MSTVASQKKPLKVGPFGSDNGGERFDDGVHSTMRQVVVCSSLSSILYIQIEYDDDGSSSWSPKHGSSNPIGVDKIETVKLDYPNEYLTSIHGYYTDRWYYPTYITSLTFTSNRKVYGPFGNYDNERRMYFSIQVLGSKIVGFHGRSDDLFDLRAIGAYLKTSSMSTAPVHIGYPAAYNYPPLPPPPPPYYGNYWDPNHPPQAGNYWDPNHPPQAGNYWDPNHPPQAGNYWDPNHPPQAGNYWDPNHPPQAGNYWDPNHPPQAAPPAPTPYPYSNFYIPPPPPSYNNGYYHYQQEPLPAALGRPNKVPKSAPSKPKAAKNNGPKNVSYRVLGNEVSGNTGDHTGVFNVGNKNTGRHMEDDDEDEE